MTNKELNKEVRDASNEHGALIHSERGRCFQEARHLSRYNSLRGMSVSWFFFIISFIPGLLMSNKEGR